MAIWELTSDGIERLSETTFAAEKIRERFDLQRILRENIDVVAPGVMVICEEYCDWEESRRRIDLLGIRAGDANLVVIELKRTEDGGHMELQALRYAAMVSSMTFARAVQTYRGYLSTLGRDGDPEAAILEFLGWDEPREEEFAQDVGIVLASAEFSKELTTSAIWLNERQLDIRCVRLKPYRLDERVLLDVQQVVPLPEAAAYQVQMREKASEERRAKASKADFTRYDLEVAGKTFKHQWKRRLIYQVVRAAVCAGISPDELRGLMTRPERRWVALDGKLDSETFRGKMGAVLTSRGNPYSPDRFFVEEDELLYFGGKTYAFNNQWGTQTLAVVDRIAQAYPRLEIRVEKSAGQV